MRVVRVRRVALRRPGCGVVAKRMVCVPGRIRARMSDDNLACTPAQWERIISRYADPARSNSPAGRVAGLLRDDARASDLVREWVEDQAMRCMAKGQTVTPTLLTMICKRCSKEAILHRELGVSVKLLRAGSPNTVTIMRRGVPRAPSGNACGTRQWTRTSMARWSAA